MPKQITINKKKLEEIAVASVGMLDARIPPFNQPNLFPDAIIPEGIEPGSMKHALFLFHSCSLDSMRQASEVYQDLGKLSAKYDLTQLSEVQEQELIECLGKGIMNTMGNPLETLIGNAIKLKSYDNDPRNLKMETINETIGKIASFKQFRKEKAALLLKNYVRFGIWDFPENEIFIKIDRHVLRICIGCMVIEDYSGALIKNQDLSTMRELQETVDSLIRKGLFTSEDYEAGKIEVLRSKNLTKPLSDAFREYTTRSGMSSVKLDDALWGIGAKLCYLNRELYCRLCCGIRCDSRPPSDRSATYFFPGLEKRKMAGNFLFN